LVCFNNVSLGGKILKFPQNFEKPMFSRTFRGKNLNIFKSLPNSWKNREIPEKIFLTKNN